MWRRQLSKRIHIGWGTWDSWGISIEYCHYDRSFGVNLLHWYFYIEVWPADVKSANGE